MAAVGAASVTGSVTGMTDIALTGAAKKAMDATESYEKMAKAGKEAAKNII